MIYHVGKNGTLPGDKQVEYMRLFEDGKVHLVQKLLSRDANGWGTYQYMAVPR
jgi:hypothetical protein